jgi:membrane-associated PAP2 superfamily phosphatase
MPGAGRGRIVMSSATAARAPSQLRSDAWVALIGLVLLLAWEWSGLDLAITRAYGSHSGFAWRDAWFTRALLHDGGRALAWGVMALLVIDAWRPFTRGPSRTERAYWIGVTLVCLLLVPTLKRVADSSCPWDLAEFGGVAHYVPHWRLGVRDGGPGHCFPSGHAVAAFAFLTVYFVQRRDRPAIAAWSLVAVCTLGVLFGWSQLARGAHFASHSLWSAWLCWVVCAMAAQYQAHAGERRRSAATTPA